MTPPPLPIYVINLAARTDRLAHMEAELGRLGLAFERIDAVDAAAIARAGIANRHLAPGALGCTLSHQESHRRFLASGAPWAVVLEDDVFLADAARRLLAGSDWIPAGTDLVKLETFRTRVFLRGRGASAGPGHAVHELRFRHNGSAAYVVSRAYAERFAAIDPAAFTHAMDEVLFDPRLRVLPQFRVGQLVPAVAIQEMKRDPDGALRLATDVAAPLRRAAAAPDQAKYRGLLGRLRFATRAARHRLADALRTLRQMARSKTVDLTYGEVAFGERADG
ncbi:glycosyltransferase family 25 protein [Siculibacillus lacustris]|uniref:glycosyltransferase family 25 protein n=1 Tax=Siculibacillus lacustris TaxID=1549641 RepID=UPI0013F16717|nr:glycosyltransferase family 25 protein [Siculibacillus lacustris]